jgi:hypothetical protein
VAAMFAYNVAFISVYIIVSNMEIIAINTERIFASHYRLCPLSVRQRIKLFSYLTYLTFLTAFHLSIDILFMILISTVRYVIYVSYRIIIFYTD